MPALQGIQILLAAVIVTLTALLIFVGVQVVLILKEAHLAVKKINASLEKTKTVSSFEQIRPRFSVFGFLEQLISRNGEKFEETTETHLQLEKEEPTDDVLGARTSDFSHITRLQETGRRVFHREGKPLA